MTEEPGSKRWNWLAEGNAKQARKRVAVDVLIRDEQGRILLVNPTYKANWDMPGGMSEENESPRRTAQRELEEELSLDVVPSQLLVIDWIPPHGPWDDLLHLVFDGGTLDRGTVESLGPDGQELSEAAFWNFSDCGARLSQRTFERLKRSLRAREDRTTSYVENFEGD